MLERLMLTGAAIVFTIAVLAVSQGENTWLAKWV